MDKIEKNKAEIEQRLEVVLMEIEAENARLRSDLDMMTDAYNEVSGIVGHQGTEEYSAVEDVRRIVAENARLKAYARHERNLGAEGPMIDLVGVRQELEQTRAKNARLRALLHRWAVWGEGQEHDLEVETRRALEGEK